MKIYTKTGDGGTTGLVGGSRVGKDSLRIEAIGQVDELNAALGIARSLTLGNALEEPIAGIQGWLFELGAELATPPESKYRNRMLSESQVEFLEESIDAMTQQLETQIYFILPGGCAQAAALHFARCVCRRAERHVLALHRAEPLRAELLAFLNRLSDWIHVAARTSNYLAGVQDIKWNEKEG